jgi:predicted SAM-dependent methyltransferase
MNVREILKRSDTIVGLVRDLRKIPILIKILSNQANHDRRIKSYLESNKIKKLHLGAGTTPLHGWLNTDIDIKLDNIVYLDATRVFPFDDNTFDYIFTEHMIEHITWHKALFMLKECMRILKPRGIMRIATPDLEMFIGLYLQNDNPLNEQYVKWVTDSLAPYSATCLHNISIYKAAFVINNAFRYWGHQFLYDSDLLSILMKEAGFTNIRRYSPGESNDDNLVGIESHGKAIGNDEMVRFETMVCEGECPV